MYIPYAQIVNKVYDTIVLSDLFNPAKDNNSRIVNQVQRLRFVPGAPFPAIMIHILSKDEAFRALGYTPFADISVRVKIFCSIPSSKSTAKLLGDLGFTSIDDEWKAEQEMLYIQQKLEEWIRGDSTEEGKSRRALGCNGISGIDIHVALLSRTTFGMIDAQNLKIITADNIFTFANSRIR